jgi:hypothetical protein
MSQPTLESLMAVIRTVHRQRGDDTCWMDIDHIFAAAGLPVPDRKVGDKFAMIRNCGRFIETMCADGQWLSYADLEKALAVQNEEICQTLGKALGYPWYKDDQRNFPGATEANGVCVGDHVAETIACEAAKKIGELMVEVEKCHAYIRSAR